jgi:hypothetical protein
LWIRSAAIYLLTVEVTVYSGVVTAVGQRCGVQRAGFLEQVRPFRCGCQPRALYEIAELPEIDPDGGRVQAVLGVGPVVGEVAAGLGVPGAAEDMS